MRKLLISLILLIILAVGVFAYWTVGNQARNPSDQLTKRFVIQKGDSIREIGISLKKEDLIKDPVVFFVYIRLYGQDKKIQAGEYRLSPSMRLAKIVEELQYGTLDRWITIPEGYRAEEIASVLEKEIPSYEGSWRDVLNENEGYLFPDTYLIPRDAEIDMIVSIMRNNFNRKIQEIGLASNDKDLPRIIILASLIEREAVTNEEKPLISGVINNRLRRGMALDIDATIQYVKGREGAWWPQITTDDYKNADSLYNTYLNPGFPPGPIANPGIEAIKAALKPQTHTYYFYIHSDGKIYPARTVGEHQANIKKYLNN